LRRRAGPGNLRCVVAWSVAKLANAGPSICPFGQPSDATSCLQSRAPARHFGDTQRSSVER
jgi:hypothetical protein